MWITSKRPTKSDSFSYSIDPIIISSIEHQIKIWLVFWHHPMRKRCIFNPKSCLVSWGIHNIGSRWVDEETADSLAGAPLVLQHMFIEKSGGWIANTCSLFFSSSNYTWICISQSTSDKHSTVVLYSLSRTLSISHGRLWHQELMVHCVSAPMLTKSLML